MSHHNGENNNSRMDTTSFNLDLEELDNDCKDNDNNELIIDEKHDDNNNNHTGKMKCTLITLRIYIFYGKSKNTIGKKEEIIELNGRNLEDLLRRTCKFLHGGMYQFIMSRWERLLNIKIDYNYKGELKKNGIGSTDWINGDNNILKGKLSEILKVCHNVMIKMYIKYGGKDNLAALKPVFEIVYKDYYL